GKFEAMMYPNCPQCNSSNAYPLDEIFVCPDCFHEFTIAANNNESEDEVFVVKDSNGNVLQDGDAVVIIKTLPVKGSSQAIKAGTKVKNIKLVDSDHNIDCKIDGFGSMALKSEFVKKA